MGCLCLALVHPFSEIPDHLVVHAGLHSPGLAPQHHVILHHLVPLIENAVPPQLVKAVRGRYVNGFLSLQAGVQVHELVFAGEILAVLPPIIEGAQIAARAAAEKPSLDRAFGEHLLHILVSLFPGFLGENHLLALLGDIFHLQGAVHKHIRRILMHLNISQQQPHPQVGAARRAKPFQIRIYIIFQI